ncbi:MAG: mRNA-degrading endonuclease toxin of MazEF toxin-antitoxin module [Salibacteraceae bacterium]|jgi:mRNA-degrading endonuclease toxin of MazEF toxin-antitoxin module
MYSLHVYFTNIKWQPTKESDLDSTSEILTFHIYSISKARLEKKIRNIIDTQLSQIKSCLNDLMTY